MKKFHKFISIILCLTLVLASSTSFVFGAATQWDTSDSQHLTGIYNSLVSSTSNGVLKALLQIESDLATYMPLKSDVKTISTTLGQIWSALSFAIDGQYISVFVARIMTAVEGLDVDLSTIVSRLTSINTQTTNTAANTAGIYNLINGYDNVLIDNIPKIDDVSKALTNYYYSYGAGYISSSEIARNGHAGLLTYNSSQGKYQLTYGFPYINSSGTQSTAVTSWAYGSPLGNLIWMFKNFASGFVNQSLYRNVADINGYNSTQTFTNWNGSTLTTSTFTPTSAINGIYSWFSDIQTPIARLAFVHASDEEIEARQLAEANQTAVVDNFINPNGSGSVPTSSIGSVSDMSDSFKDNFSTDASPTGLFDIFNSDHGSWFSQETANQLDTTNLNNRSLKAAPSDDFETPLLDQQIDDIYNALGVKK